MQLSLQGDKFLCLVKCCHFQILIEFWLNQNTTPSISSNVLSHGKVKFIILIVSKMSSLNFKDGRANCLYAALLRR